MTYTIIILIKNLGYISKSMPNKKYTVGLVFSVTSSTFRNRNNNTIDTNPTSKKFVRIDSI